MESYIGWLQIAIYCLILLITVKPVGTYLYCVFESDNKSNGLTGKVNAFIAKFLGDARPQSAKSYITSVLILTVLSVFIVTILLMFQAFLPLNGRLIPSLPFDLALNTAISFVTNTNWQAYSGEVTMSNFSQVAVLSWQNFLSPAVGLAIAIAVCRGIAGKEIGNFWQDLMKSFIYVLLPASFIFAIFFASQGVIQTFAHNITVITLEGFEQIIPAGSVASQEAIKMLGTNGGGFFNANSAHPFENPTPLSNFVQMIMIFMIPAGLTYTFGKIVADQKQGWAIFSVMFILFIASVTINFLSEQNLHSGLNMEGKENRFSLAESSLFSTVTTSASAGAVNSMHDSFSPLSGMMQMINMMLGEIIFGGVGAGLYGMMIYVIMTVFIAGLMVGRTPEYMGKKIEPFEIKMATLAIIILPLCILCGTAITLSTDFGLASVQERGVHGLSEVLYAFTSATANNGSAFAGINANSIWMNYSLSLCMLLGRLVPIIAVICIAYSLSRKTSVPSGIGTFPTNGGVFIFMLSFIILVFGALTFFPVLTLGPVVEHFQILSNHPKM